LKLKKFANISEMAQKVYKMLDKSKLKEALKNDNKYYIDEFSWHVDGNNDYINDDDEIKDLNEAYEEYMKDEKYCDSSDTYDLIMEAISDCGFEDSDELLDEITKLLGYDSIGEYIANEGYDEYSQKILDKAENDLKEFLKDQNDQQRETEHMRYDSYNW